MPKIDFSKVEDVQDYTPLPDGAYDCKLEKIEEARTQYEDEMWRMEFMVLSGQYAGRKVFDNLVFSESAMKRVKLVTSRLGLKTDGEVDLTPAMILGRKCRLTVNVEEYVDHEGRKKKRNTVPFAGYEKFEEGKEAAKPEEEEAF